MDVVCELFVSSYFQLSSGYTVLVGKMKPNVAHFIANFKADLYIDDKKIMTISLVGEDRFSGVDESKRKDVRAVRTEDKIESVLRNSESKEIKLVIWE